MRRPITLPKEPPANSQSYLFAATWLEFCRTNWFAIKGLPRRIPPGCVSLPDSLNVPKPQLGCCSNRLRAGNAESYGVEGYVAADVEGHAVFVAEGAVGGALFWYEYLADELAFGRVAVDAVVGACPDVSLHIAAETVGDAGSDDCKYAEVGERLAIRVDVESGYVARVPRCRRRRGSIRRVRRLGR